MKLTMPNSERLLPPLEILAVAMRDGELAALERITVELAAMTDADFAVVMAAVTAGWGGNLVAQGLEVVKYDRPQRANVIAFPPRTASNEAVNLEELFASADKAIVEAASVITALLEPLTYDQLVLVSDRAGEVFGMPQFVKDVICDEFGRRHQQMYPEVYPPDGVA